MKQGSFEVLDDENALHSLVRRSLSNSVLGRPYCDVALDLYQCILEKHSVPDKYVGRWVQPVIEQIGTEVAIEFAHECLERPLDGLLIASDMELFWDPVTIGSLFKATRQSVMMTGAILSTPKVGKGSSALVLAMPTGGCDGRGFAKYEVLMKGLKDAGVSLKFCRKVWHVCQSTANTPEAKPALRRPSVTTHSARQQFCLRNYTASGQLHGIGFAGYVNQELLRSTSPISLVGFSWC